MEFWSNGIVRIVGIAPRARGVGSPFGARSFVPKPRAESFRPWAILLRHFHGNRSILRDWHRLPLAGRPDDPADRRALAYIELPEVEA